MNVTPTNTSILNLSSPVWGVICAFLELADVAALLDVGCKSLLFLLSEPVCIPSITFKQNCRLDSTQMCRLVRSLPHLKAVTLESIHHVETWLNVLKTLSISRLSPLETLKMTRLRFETTHSSESIGTLFPNLKKLEIEVGFASFGQVSYTSQSLGASLLKSLPDTLDILITDYSRSYDDLLPCIPPGIKVLTIPSPMLQPQTAPASGPDPNTVEYISQALQYLFDRCSRLEQLVLPYLRSFPGAPSSRIVCPATLRKLTVRDLHRDNGPSLDLLDAQGVEELIWIADERLETATHFPPSLTSLIVKRSSPFVNLSVSGPSLRNLPHTVTRLQIRDDRHYDAPLSLNEIAPSLKHLKISPSMIIWDALPSGLETLFVRKFQRPFYGFGNGPPAPFRAVGPNSGVGNAEMMVEDAESNFRFPPSLTSLHLLNDFLEPNRIQLLPLSLKLLVINPKGTWTDQDVVSLVTRLPSTFIFIQGLISVVTPPVMLFDLPNDHNNGIGNQKVPHLEFDLERHIESFLPLPEKGRVHVDCWKIDFRCESHFEEGHLHLGADMAHFRSIRISEPSSSPPFTFPAPENFSHFAYPTNEQMLRRTGIHNVQIDVEKLLDTLVGLAEYLVHLETLDLTLRETEHVNIVGFNDTFPNLKHLRISCPTATIALFDFESLPRHLLTFHAPIDMSETLTLDSLPPYLTDLKLVSLSGGVSFEMSFDLWPISLQRLEVSTSQWTEDDLCSLKRRLVNAKEIIIWGQVAFTGTLLRKASLDSPLLELDQNTIPVLMNHLLAPIRVMTFVLGPIWSFVPEEPLHSFLPQWDTVGTHQMGGSSGNEKRSKGKRMPNNAKPMTRPSTPPPSLEARPSHVVLPDSLTSLSLQTTNTIRPHRKPKKGKRRTKRPSPFTPRDSILNLEDIPDISFLPFPWPTGLTSLTLCLNTVEDILDQSGLVWPANLTKLHIRLLSRANISSPFQYLPPKLIDLRVESQSLTPSSSVVCPSSLHSPLAPTFESFDCPFIYLPIDIIEWNLNALHTLHFKGGESWTDEKMAQLLKSLPLLQSLFVGTAYITGTLLPDDTTEVTASSFVKMTLKALQALLANQRATIDVGMWFYAQCICLPRSITKLHFTTPPRDDDPINVPGHQKLRNLLHLPILPPNLTDLCVNFSEKVYLGIIGSLLPRTLQTICVMAQDFIASDFHWMTFPSTLKTLKVLASAQTANPPTYDGDPVGLPPSLEVFVMPTSPPPPLQELPSTLITTRFLGATQIPY